jgi:hypothetical protein
MSPTPFDESVDTPAPPKERRFKLSRYALDSHSEARKAYAQGRLRSQSLRSLSVCANFRYSLSCDSPKIHFTVADVSSVTRVIRANLVSHPIRHARLRSPEKELNTPSQSAFVVCVYYIRDNKFDLPFLRRTATLEDRMHHLETLIQAIPTNVFDAAGHRSGSEPLQSPVDVDIPNSNGLPLNGPASYPAGVPPPSLSVASLTNPSTHFSPPTMPVSFSSAFGPSAADQLAESNSRLSLSHSYMYFDEQGCKRWQGETSGLPLLDLLFDGAPPTSPGEWPPTPESPSNHDHNASSEQWFPDRIARQIDVNPETLWKVITSCISPDLMDTYVDYTSHAHEITHNPCLAVLCNVTCQHLTI